MRLISSGRRDVLQPIAAVGSAAWSRAPPPGQWLWRELAAPSGIKQSIRANGNQASGYVDLKKTNKKRRLHISFNSFSQMHYSDGIICWELRGSQRCSSTTEGRGLFKCLWLFSPPHRQTRGRRLLFNVFTASRFSSELSTFLNFTQPEIKWCVCRCRCSWEDAGGTFWSLTIRLESLDRKKTQQLFFSSKPLKWLMATKDEHLNP